MASAVVARRRPGRAVRSPSSRARSTADSTAPPRPPGRARGAASSRRTGTSRAGWRCPGPAMSGAEPWTGSNRPGPPSPSDALGQHADRAGEHRRLVAEDVAEHVLGEDHVEVARARRRAASRRCRRAGARARRSGTPRAWTRMTTSRHRRLVSSTLALSTLVTRERAASEGDAGDPLDLGRACRRRRRRRGRRCASFVAEVDAAGELAHDEQVGALDALARSGLAS